MAKKSKGLEIKVSADNVMYTSISKNKNGYNSAFVNIKLGDNQYMSVSYEWEGSSMPAGVLDLMGFMKANKEVIDESIKEKASDFDKYKEGV